MLSPKELKALYEKGENVMAYMRREKDSLCNLEEMVEISYDLQSGSYIERLNDQAFVRHYESYTEEIAKTVLTLCKPNSILEAGVGEATTFGGVIKKLNLDEMKSYGFDLCWSRVAYARNWLRSQGILNATLCTGSLLNIPFAENSIDVVYTYHSTEPNGGKEEAILKELYRIANKFLVLFEPDYELASDEAKRRMEEHGYCKNLKKACESLGYLVIEHKMACYATNPLNPPAITIVEKKNSSSEKKNFVLACPKFKTPVYKIGNAVYSPEALVAYPILEGIPCLRIENGIIASKIFELNSGFESLKPFSG